MYKAPSTSFGSSHGGSKSESGGLVAILSMLVEDITAAVPATIAVCYVVRVLGCNGLETKLEPHETFGETEENSRRIYDESKVFREHLGNDTALRFDIYIYIYVCMLCLVDK